MEENPSNSLATESFSYSWLTNIPTPSSLINSTRPVVDDDEDHTHTESEATDQNFDFNVVCSLSDQYSIVHADKIFSNGIIIPAVFQLHPSKQKEHDQLMIGATNYSIDTFSYSSSSSCRDRDRDRDRDRAAAASCPRKKWWISNYKDTVIKCLSAFIPAWCPKINSTASLRRRRSTRVDDLDRRSSEVKSFINHEASPARSSTASYNSPAGNWSDSISESSIHEAILYCKRSSGN
ncbi:hypothetical protein Dimus_006599 [Dionaea muscipula]